MEEVFNKLLWILTYASIVGSERENDETAVMAANTAVHRYREAWDGRREEAP